MDSPYIFNYLKSLRPQEIFHPIEMYALKWQPPRSRYIVITPLNDPQLQENLLIQLHNMLPRERKLILFSFAPINPSVNLFAEKVHPASLVSYRTNDKVLNKLCDQYMEGKLSLSELQNVLTTKPDVWKLTMYNLLPADEQEYHRYLTVVEKQPNMKDIEKLYYDDSITLQEFADLKFPERKKQKDIESLTYPRPYVFEQCIVCGVEDKATITCQNCTNMVCTDCITTYFLNESTREGSSTG